MTARRLSWGLLGAAVLAGTLADRVPVREPRYAGGYRILAVDLHVHPFPSSAALIAPWDLVLEARHQGLDAIAITGHNETWSGQVGRWFSRLVGGPTVIPGEEIHGPRFHMIGAGIQRTISWRLSAEQAAAEVHRQGGVAIAAHPTWHTWPAYDGRALRLLDGSEVGQPAVFGGKSNASELREFLERSGAAAIGSSDWHGLGPMGLFRTYVFAKDDSEAAILEAIRAHRTVVVEDGRILGDLDLARLAGDGLAQQLPAPGWLRWVSGILGVAGLAGIALLSFPRASSPRDPRPAPDTARGPV